jgi:uncharacterized membrane protein
MDQQQTPQPPGLPIRSGQQPQTKPRPSLARRFLTRGLAVLLPTLLTVIIIVWLFSILYEYVAQPINSVIQLILAASMDLSQDQVRTIWNDYYLGWIGVVVALALVFAVGLLMGSLLGRTAWRVIERMLQRLPGIKQVYPYVKQVTDFVLSERPLEFSRVVLVEYPRRDCWSLGLVTGLALGDLRDATDKDMLAIFIPSSPTPFTGYVIQVPRNEVIDVPMSVDQALRFTISGGVVQPPSQLRSGPRPEAIDGE